MTALTDPRPHVFIEHQADVDDHLAAVSFGSLVRQLLDKYPDVELTTVRLWKHAANGFPTLRVDARRGQLGEPECPSCHTHGEHPHTEYCQLVDHASQLPHAELYPNQLQEIHRELIRPDDDPADEITCDGRNCGGYPHA